MATVTYKSQPAIHKTRGAVGQDGTRHPYTVSRVLWPTEVEQAISKRLLGKTLHACPGCSLLGDIRVDNVHVCDVKADAAALPFKDQSFDTVLCDPPYNGKMRWNHSLLAELSRVAKCRIIFQHWFLPIDPHGRYKKWHRFTLSEVLIWQPRTYFGRVQCISILDDQRLRTAVGTTDWCPQCGKDEKFWIRQDGPSSLTVNNPACRNPWHHAAVGVEE